VSRDLPDIVADLDLGFDPMAAKLLRRVGGKGRLGPVVHHQGQTWRAVRTGSGAATIHMAPRALGVLVKVWGPGSAEALTTVPQLLGSADNPSELVAHDPLVARLIAAAPGSYRMTRTNTIWEHIVPTVLGQKVPTASAMASWQAILHRWGEPAPGQGPTNLVLGPHPDRLAELAYHDLHPMNVERKRAEVIITAARRWKALERALGKQPDAARSHLQAIRGVGPWTASIVTQLGLGDPDAVIVGDYKLPSLVAWNLAGERIATDERMLELLEPYRGQRARVQNVIKYGASGPPRHGPRIDIVDIRGR